MSTCLSVHQKKWGTYAGNKVLLFRVAASMSSSYRRCNRFRDDTYHISSQHEPDLIAQLLPLAHTKYLSMYPNCQGDMGHNLVVPQNIDLLPGNAADCSLQEQAFGVAERR
jgi:hypothetical protein